MLNYIEIQSKLANMAEATKAEVLYDMEFKVDKSEFFSLKFQKEVQFTEFINRFIQ